MVFRNGVKYIEVTGYNGAHTVVQNSRQQVLRAYFKIMHSVTKKIKIYARVPKLKKYPHHKTIIANGGVTFTGTPLYCVLDL